MKVRSIVQDVISGHKWRYSLDKASEFIEKEAESQLVFAGIKSSS